MKESQSAINEIPLNIIVGLAIVRAPLLNMCEIIGDDNRISSLIFKLFFVCYIFFIFLSLLKIYKIKLNEMKLCYSSIIIFISLFWTVLIDESYYVTDSILTLIVFMIFPFICITLINNKKQLYKYLKYFIFINYVLGLSAGYTFILSGRYYGVLGMMATYAVAVPTSFYCYMMFVSDKNKLIDLLLTILGIVIMFFTGSRGGFILLLFAVFLGLLSFRSNRDFKFFFRLAIIMIFIGIFFYNKFLELFEGTRILDILEGGEFTGSGGRDPIYKMVLNGISERPLLGWGLYGDRVCTNGIYSHNIFLEIWCDFGIVLGSLFIFWLIFNTIRLVFFKMNRTITILFLMAIPQLLVSSSFLLSSYFWIYIGALISFSNNSYKKISAIT